MADESEEITRNDGPGLEAWEAWTPAEAATHLAGVSVPWCVVGGWAIDLFLGEQTRDHEDLEIEILRPDFPVVKEHLAAFEFFAAGSGQIVALTSRQDWNEAWHQRWVLEPGAQKWRADVMLAPGDAQSWVCRRRGAVTAPRAEIVDVTNDGIPFLRPEAVLLYKAKAARPKDEADLAACLPRMSGSSRAWLADALARAHPDHPWMAQMT